MERTHSEDNFPYVFSGPNSPVCSSRSTTPDLEMSNGIPVSVKSVQKICCVGAGYVGGPTAAVIALKNPDIQVSVVDLSVPRIQKWNSKHLPIHEPGLDAIVRIARDGTRKTECQDHTGEDIVLPARKPNLFFSTDVNRCVSEADVVFVSVNTPTKSSGIGAGAATDLSSLEAAVTSIAQYVKPGAIIVEKSTVPCGTAQLIREIVSESASPEGLGLTVAKLAMYRPNESFEVLSNPEFLAEGTAVSDLLNPDRILIGSQISASGRAAADTLKAVYASWVDPSRVMTVNIWSSELAKLVANAMLAQRISSINTISAICDRTGADIDEIATAVGHDSRLGSKFLKAGVGFGGSCFKKDILNLTYLARSLHLPEVADYWMFVLAINDFQMDRFTRRVVGKLNGALARKKITVLGFTFKQDTNDTRESPAINVIKGILTERPAEIAVYDPGCSVREITDCIQSEVAAFNPNVLQPIGPVRAYDNAYDACAGSSAVLILTSWNQFRYPTSAALFETDRNQADRYCYFSIPSTPRSALLDAVPECLVDGPSCTPDCAQCLSNDHDKVARANAPLDWSLVADTMQEPKWVFDGRNIVDRKAMDSLGFRIENLGKPFAT